MPSRYTDAATWRLLTPRRGGGIDKMLGLVEWGGIAGRGISHSSFVSLPLEHFLILFIKRNNNRKSITRWVSDREQTPTKKNGIAGGKPIRRECSTWSVCFAAKRFSLLRTTPLQYFRFSLSDVRITAPRFSPRILLAVARVGFFFRAGHFVRCFGCAGPLEPTIHPAGGKK